MKTSSIALEVFAILVEFSMDFDVNLFFRGALGKIL